MKKLNLKAQNFRIFSNFSHLHRLISEKSDIFGYTLFKGKTPTVQRGNYGPVEGKGRGGTMNVMCARGPAFFEFRSVFFAYGPLKMGKV